MKEFMLLIRTEGDLEAALSPEQTQEHIQKMMGYMGDLMKSGNLKSAQPLAMEGTMVSGSKGVFKDGPFNETKEIIGGYYLIQAIDLKGAIEIAKNSPVFDAEVNARIEVRAIRVLEGING